MPEHLDQRILVAQVMDLQNQILMQINELHQQERSVTNAFHVARESWHREGSHSERQISEWDQVVRELLEVGLKRNAVLKEFVSQRELRMRTLKRLRWMGQVRQMSTLRDLILGFSEDLEITLPKQRESLARSWALVGIARDIATGSQ